MHTSLYYFQQIFMAINHRTCCQELQIIFGNNNPPEMRGAQNSSSVYRHDGGTKLLIVLSESKKEYFPKY